MTTLPQLIPDIDTLLSLRPEETAPAVLKIARESRQGNNVVHMSHLMGQLRGDSSQGRPGYPQERIADAERALAAAWSWLQREGLLIPAPGDSHGWMMLSQDAERIGSDADFAHFKNAAAFPKFLLHPKIADDVHGELMRGQFDTAVFKSMRAVEEAVRAAGGFKKTDLGPDMMRRAFKTGSGPLTNPSEPAAEQEAVASLFAGAIGYFKNPHSHRTVNEDPDAARQLSLFASLLLAMVDERDPRGASGGAS